MTVYLRVPGQAGLDLDITFDPIRIVGVEEISRPGRNTVHDVVGAVLPVVVTEVHGARRFALRVHTATLAARDELDAILSAGRTLTLDAAAAPPSWPIPTMRVVVGDYSMRRAGSRRSESCVFVIPLTEVAAVPTTIGLATVTLGGLTLTAVGRRRLTGTAAVALGGLTLAATGRRSTSGTAAVALGELTIAATGVVNP